MKVLPPAPPVRRLQQQPPEGWTIEEEATLEPAEVVSRLRQTFTSPSYRPPMLPTVAVEMLALSRRPTTTVNEMAALLERDPVLAAQVLRRAHSAYYAGLMPVRTLGQAITRLGLSALRDLVFEVALDLRVFRAQGYAASMEKLRLHSISVAHIARAVARYTPFESDHAFLCGLLHDIGIAAILLALGDLPQDKKPDLDPLWPAIDEAHEEASATIARLWKVPEEIALVVGHHHRVLIGGVAHPLVALLSVAEALAAELGCAFAPAAIQPALVDSTSSKVLERAWAELRLAGPTVAQVRKEAKASLNALGGANPAGL